MNNAFFLKSFAILQQFVADKTPQTDIRAGTVVADDFAVAHIDSRRRSLAAVVEQIVIHAEEGPVPLVRIAAALRRGGLARGIGGLPVRRVYFHGIVFVVQVEGNLKELDGFLGKLDVGIHSPRSYGIVGYRVGGTPLGLLGLGDQAERQAGCQCDKIFHIYKIKRLFHAVNLVIFRITYNYFIYFFK